MNTLRHYWLLALMCCTAVHLAAQELTLEECVGRAQANYPLIRKYDILERTTAVNLSDIRKGWLPQLSVYGQGTVQNETPSFPDVLAGMLRQNGMNLEGLDNWQYKVGADLSQTVWDGGASRSQRKVERAREAERRTSVDVQLHAVRQRVEDLFFGILLVEEQVRQTEATLSLLRSNLERLRVMHRNGTAMQCDVDRMEAQCLVSRQQLTQAESTATTFRRLLGLFVGEPLEGRTLALPDAELPTDLTPARPELKLFDARLLTNEARQADVTAGVMPRVGLFAQAYYGYPGFNYFESMMQHDLSLNLLAGVRVSWNIGALYTKRNARQRLRLSSADIAAERDAFLFNNRLEVREQLDRIDELKRVMEDDSRIVELRTNVRRAAESQLTNGVIDTTDLLGKLTDENRARLDASYHRIQLLQHIYQLKHTVNQ